MQTVNWKQFDSSRILWRPLLHMFRHASGPELSAGEPESPMYPPQFQPTIGTCRTSIRRNKPAMSF